jgi:hypothetical protein
MRGYKAKNIFSRKVSSLLLLLFVFSIFSNILLTPKPTFAWNPDSDFYNNATYSFESERVIKGSGAGLNLEFTDRMVDPGTFRGAIDPFEPMRTCGFLWTATTGCTNETFEKWGEDAAHLFIANDPVVKDQYSVYYAIIMWPNAAAHGGAKYQLVNLITTTRYASSPEAIFLDWDASDFKTISVAGTAPTTSFESKIFKDIKFTGSLVSSSDYKTTAESATNGTWEDMITFGTTGKVEILLAGRSFGTMKISSKTPVEKTIDGEKYYSLPLDTATIASMPADKYRLTYYIGKSAAAIEGIIPIGGESTAAAEIKFTLDGSGKITVTTDDPIAKASPINNKTIADGGGGEFFVPLTITKTNPLDAAIGKAITWMLQGISKTMNWTMGQVNGLLNQTADMVVGRAGEKTPAMYAPWISIRNIALSLLVMALIIIAFANVLQIDIEQYGLNRMIPRIIISIIMAYASWIIVIFFFDLSAAISGQAKGLSGGIDMLASLGKMSVAAPTSGQVLADIGIFFLIIAVLILTVACGIILLFMLLIRIVMLSFLLVIAPLAFILNIMPFTANLYKQWWSEFFKWMFMGPIALAIIALGGLIANSTSFGAGSADLTKGLGVISSSGGKGGALIGLVIFAASLYMAATLPMQWGGKIMSSWGGVGKKLWGGTGGAALGFAGKTAWDRTGGSLGRTVGGIFKGRSDARHQREDLVGLERRSDLANSRIPGMRQVMTGTSKAQAAQLKQAIDGQYDAQYGRLEAKELQNIQQSMTSTPRQKIAAFKAMQNNFDDGTKAYAKKGELDRFGQWVDGGDPVKRKDMEDAAKEEAARHLGGLMAGDRELLKFVADNNPEAAIMSAEASKKSNPALAQQLSGKLLSSTAGKSWTQKNHKVLGAMATMAGKYSSDPRMASFKTALSSAGSSEARTKLLMDRGVEAYDAQMLVSAYDHAGEWRGFNATQQENTTRSMSGKQQDKRNKLSTNMAAFF